MPGSPGIVRHETKKYGIFGVIQEKFMTSAEAIERAIEQLPPDELSKFRRWFLEFDAAAWDAQLVKLRSKIFTIANSILLLTYLII